MTSAGRILLLFSVFIVAACGLIYELVAGAVSSYLLGDAVTQFSLVIGVFLSAMGLGSYFAKFITRRLLYTFIEIEIIIGVLGGLSSLSMYAVGAFLDSIFVPCFYSLCAVLGILIGIEIPLLVRILNESQGVEDALSNVLALDYAGALLGSICFPFLVLPYLGLSRASIVFGIMNLGVAAVATRLISKKTPWFKIQIGLAALILMIALGTSQKLVGFLEDFLYQDNIIYGKTTAYQRIILTKWRTDIRLYLNGHIQFSSIDEYRYHEALVIPAMEAVKNPRSVLILGGGDGMVAREVLKYKSVRQIVLVDIDPVMTHLGQTKKELVQLNKNALNASQVKIIHQDAMKFLEHSNAFFDCIIIDLPDPNTETLSKLYSTAFYALCFRRLTPVGVLVTQATSPYYASNAFWCIHKTIKSTLEKMSAVHDNSVFPMHVHVPSFGEWGFILASAHRINTKMLVPSIQTRFLTSEKIKTAFVFGKDIQQPKEPIEANRLDNPILYLYYQKGWARFNS